jgi:hypothetical protein
MSQALLKVLLTSGSSSIVFDARPGSQKGSDRPGPFFSLGVLKNAIVLKAGVGHSELTTKLFLPFDSANTTRGGLSMECTPDMTAGMLETFFDVRFDPATVAKDLKKIEILARTPSFAPFLLRDAFERSGVDVDLRHFQVSDDEVRELKDILKAKLKPLAALALPAVGANFDGSKLELLVNKLWDLNDLAFLAPLTRALKILEGEEVETLYAWIGVSYFNREFTKRQTYLRKLAQWLVSKPPFGPGTREEVIAQFEADRKPIRDRVRAAWSAAGSIFDRFNSSLDRLIQHSDASLFIENLSRARADFEALGLHLALIEQALCIHGAIAREPKGSQLSLDLVRELSVSMRGADARLVAA